MSIAKEGEGHEGLARIGQLNRAANLAIRALNTSPADDEWRSSLAILARSSGDCKHYAVLKYAMLRELGVSPDALKILVVEVRSIHQQHAILAVRAENGRWLLLDNRTLMLVESSMALDYYDPLYQLDENGVRQFGLPSRSPELAQSLPDKVVFDHCCLFRHRHRDRMASKQTKILNNNQLRQLLPTQAAYKICGRPSARWYRSAAGAQFSKAKALQISQSTRAFLVGLIEFNPGPMDAGQGNHQIQL